MNRMLIVAIAIGLGNAPHADIRADMRDESCQVLLTHWFARSMLREDVAIYLDGVMAGSDATRPTEPNFQTRYSNTCLDDVNMSVQEAIEKTVRCMDDATCK